MSTRQTSTNVSARSRFFSLTPCSMSTFRQRGSTGSSVRCRFCEAKCDGSAAWAKLSFLIAFVLAGFCAGLFSCLPSCLRACLYSFWSLPPLFHQMQLHKLFCISPHFVHALSTSCPHIVFTNLRPHRIHNLSTLSTICPQAGPDPLQSSISINKWKTTNNY